MWDETFASHPMGEKLLKYIPLHDRKKKIVIFVIDISLTNSNNLSDILHSSHSHTLQKRLISGSL